MKKIISLSLLFFNSVLESRSQSDSIAIVHLLKEDYKTMVNHDVAKHISLCTQDYLLIENGEIWTMAMEVEDYKSKAHRKLERKDSFNFKLLNIVGNTAYAVYELKSSITENGKLTIWEWTESSIFRKENDQWRIALIHSTPKK